MKASAKIKDGKLTSEDLKTAARIYGEQQKESSNKVPKFKPGEAAYFLNTECSLISGGLVFSVFQHRDTKEFIYSFEVEGILCEKDLYRTWEEAVEAMVSSLATNAPDARINRKEKK